ncbi:MAG: DNA/RNA non-specific endonuclease [Bacteroides sp.]|nr:DNA/RNA non-specific endonuclease [Bacteroides sp.]
MAQKRKPGKRSKKKKASRINRGLWIILLILLVMLFSAILLLMYDQYKQRPSDKPVSSYPIPTAPTTKPTRPTTKSTPTSKPTTPAGKVSYTSLHIPQYTTSSTECVAHHTGYTVSFNTKYQIPNWVGYELTREKTKGDAKRSNRFVSDPTMPECCAHTSDYTQSGYDRGHMVPAADMKWNTRAMEETFFLSNICPQHPDLNQKRWKELEDKVRDWAIADSAIIIVCGPLINTKSRKTVGKNKVKVPEGFFKVILSPYKENPEAIGFIFKNKKAVNPLHTYVVSVDSVESLTGLDFFSELPDSIEEKIEARTNLVYWGLK